MQMGSRGTGKGGLWLGRRPPAIGGETRAPPGQAEAKESDGLDGPTPCAGRCRGLCVVTCGLCFAHACVCTCAHVCVLATADTMLLQGWWAESRFGPGALREIPGRLGVFGGRLGGRLGAGAQGLGDGPVCFGAGGSPAAKVAGVTLAPCPTVQRAPPPYTHQSWSG